jgi:hypothetical protein
MVDDLETSIAELEAMAVVARALLPLSVASRGRVIGWASGLPAARPGQATNQERHHDP